MYVEVSVRMIKKGKKNFRFLVHGQIFGLNILMCLLTHMLLILLYIYLNIYNVMFVNIYIYIIEFPQYIYNLILSLIFLQFL